MWGTKKPEPPAKPVEPRDVAVPPAPAPSVPPPKIYPEARDAGRGVEETPMNANEPFRPTAVTPTGGNIARLGTSLHVKGEITGNEDLHVDGSVEGLVSLEDRKLTVGASAKVTADVIAREIVVYGSVKGNLRARDRIEIKKDGSVVGDLTTARIMIEDGAYFKGSIEIEREGVQPGATPEKSFARAAAAQKD